MNAIAGEITQRDQKGKVSVPVGDKTLGHTTDTASTDVSESGSCMEVY